MRGSASRSPSKALKNWIVRQEEPDLKVEDCQPNSSSRESQFLGPLAGLPSGVVSQVGMTRWVDRRGGCLGSHPFSPFISRLFTEGEVRDCSLLLNKAQLQLFGGYVAI